MKSMPLLTTKKLREGVGFSKRLGFPALDGVFLVILFMGTFLLFFHIDHNPFWQDEAETACLARNVLKYEVPKAFDGLNLISQEEGKEFDADYLWRWSPWLQIYITAAAFRIGGCNTAAGRLPFAFFGLACIVMVYLVVWRNSGDLAWARIAAALLTFYVPFLLFSRQCRYYSLGTLLVLISIYAFQRDFRQRTGPAVLLVISLGLLFHTNYLLFLSFVPPALLAALLIYRDKLSVKKLLYVSFGLAIIILPGILLFRIQEESSLIDIMKIIGTARQYVSDLLQFLIPLPVVVYLIWRWRRIRSIRHKLPAGEKFVFFLFIIIIGNIITLFPVPQSEHRYLVHLYPLCAIILGWLICQAWRYHKFSGALLALLLLFTNWLYILPMEWTGIVDRADKNARMLTYPNIPLELYLKELWNDYPDVNRYLSQFFQTQARQGDTILVTYDDLPLQFYTPFRIIGSLQGRLPAGVKPDWVVKHCKTQWNRKFELYPAEAFIIKDVLSSQGYKAIAVVSEDEIYGNIPDPYHHLFLPPPGPLGFLRIYQKISNNYSN